MENHIRAKKNKKKSNQGYPRQMSHYSSDQYILTVGDGDFSFSSCLATGFDIAKNMVATSLDSKYLLQKKYGVDAVNNIKNLTSRGARVIHKVNVRTMAKNEAFLQSAGRASYDCIIFNFPHAGFFKGENHEYTIGMHKDLLTHFFANVALMLSIQGRIHVSHKLGFPYDDWKLHELAQISGLHLEKIIPFQPTIYPGYVNRCGAGFAPGHTFQLGKAATYIFKLGGNKELSKTISTNPTFIKPARNKYGSSSKAHGKSSTQALKKDNGNARIQCKGIGALGSKETIPTSCKIKKRLKFFKDTLKVEAQHGKGSECVPPKLTIKEKRKHTWRALESSSKDNGTIKLEIQVLNVSNLIPIGKEATQMKQILEPEVVKPPLRYEEIVHGVLETKDTSNLLINTKYETNVEIQAHGKDRSGPSPKMEYKGFDDDLSIQLLDYQIEEDGSSTNAHVDAWDDSAKESLIGKMWLKIYNYLCY